jgi:uncharacterized protein (TIGR02246 family)
LLGLSCLLLAVQAAAADQGQASASNPMGGWKPPQLAHEKQDKQEINALFQRLEQAGKKGDLEGATSLIDFPVLMATDDSKGEAHAEAWSREQWSAAMKPFYAKPMHTQVKHRTTISVLSDSLATVVDRATFEMGGKSITTHSASLVVRKGGEWRIKSMVAGGWGDAMSAAMAKSARKPAAETGAGQQQQ